MRIALLFNQDIHANKALNILLPCLERHSIGLFMSSQVGKSSATHPDLTRLQFAEQTLFNRYIFPTLDQRDERKTHLTFNQIARSLSSTLTTLDDVNQETGLEKLRSFNPDLMISIRFGKILQNDAIGIPRIGTLNLHSGILPQYRGVMASFWSILQGDEEIGTTLHWISDSGIDTGAIISIKKHRVTAASYFAHVHKLYEQGAKQIEEAINLIELGKDLPTVAALGKAAYFSFPNQQDIETFKDAGKSLVDETDEIATLSRFLESWPFRNRKS